MYNSICKVYCLIGSDMCKNIFYYLFKKIKNINSLTLYTMYRFCRTG